MKIRDLFSTVLFSLAVSWAASGRAEPSTQEKALASRLFDDASKLMSSGQAAAACPKYAESERLDPELGTLLHLGECYAKIGKTASAWASFKEAGDLAGQRNDPRAPKIRDRIASLEKMLSNLVIVVAENEPSGLEIRQDGALVGRATWGAPIPIDPGEHTIVASAPGAKPRELHATIADNGQTVTLALPPIELLPPERAAETPAPQASAAPSAAPEAPRPWFSRHRKLVAVVAGGVGVAGVGVGAAFGLSAKSTYDKASPHCNGDHCDATGHDFRKSALSDAMISNIAFGAGAAALIGGTVLYLTAPKDHPSETPPTALVTPILTPQLAGISVQRNF